MRSACWLSPEEWREIIGQPTSWRGICGSYAGLFVSNAVALVRLRGLGVSDAVSEALENIARTVESDGAPGWVVGGVRDGFGADPPRWAVAVTRVIEAEQRHMRRLAEIDALKRTGRRVHRPARPCSVCGGPGGGTVRSSGTCAACALQAEAVIGPPPQADRRTAQP